jgi:hypothetical protein
VLLGDARLDCCAVALLLCLDVAVDAIRLEEDRLAKAFDLVEPFSFNGDCCDLGEAFCPTLGLDVSDAADLGRSTFEL